MEYKVKNKLYRSQNAAKSFHYKQKDLVKILLEETGKYEYALDYGCGKLRYLDNMLKLTDRLYLLDSDEQLLRKQKIHEKYTSIKEYVKFIKKVKIIRLLEINNYKNRFDFILLSNVLSCVPTQKERLNILLNIENILNKKGKALIVVQYRNPEFDKYKDKQDAIKLNNGYLFKSRGQSHYYAIIDVVQLNKLIKKTSLTIIESIELNGRLFCWVTKGNK